jgi:hypothetical protein
MRSTTPHSEDQFVLALRQKVEAVAPTIDVHTSSVIAAARRTRRRRVTATAVAAVALARAAAGWISISAITGRRLVGRGRST